MKLRKQTPAKAAIVAAAAGLLLALYGVIRAEPRLSAEQAPQDAPNYDRFFAPNVTSPAPSEPPQPVRRTRAS